MGRVSDSQQEGHQAERDMDLFNLGPSDEKQMKKITHTKKPKTKKTNALKTSQTAGKQSNIGSGDSISGFVGEENDKALQQSSIGTWRRLTRVLTDRVAMEEHADKEGPKSSWHRWESWIWMLCKDQ